MEPQVSVVIPNYNGAHLLETCLGSLAAQEFRPFEIVIVDNASHDNSREIFDAWEAPQGITKKWLQQNSNLGFPGAVNRGIEASSGEFVALLNNDTEADRNWIKVLVEKMREHPEYGFCASKLVLFSDRDMLDTAGHGFSTAGAGYARCRWAKNSGLADVETEVFGACPAASIYRKKALDEVGMLDEDFFLYYEDLDLDCRLQLAGYRCLYVPGAVVYHMVSASSGGRRSEMVVRFSSRNQEWLYIKNMPGRLVWTMLPLHLLYNMGRFAVYCIKGQGLAFIKGKLGMFSGIGRAIRQRREIQAKRRISPDEFADKLDRAWFRRHFTDHLKKGSEK